MISFAGKHLPDLFRALPGLKAYAIVAVVLVLKMQLVAIYTWPVKKRTKSSPNPEDHPENAAPETLHPDLARVHRAHHNDLENIPTFLVLGLVAVLVGVPVPWLWACLGVFAAARIGHSIFYLGARQPWRSASYGVGVLATLTLMVLVLVRAL